MSHHKKESHHIRPYKILAQSFGMLICGFFILALLGGAFPDIIKSIDSNIFPFVPIIVLPIAGYVLTWFAEKSGTAVMMAGGIILFSYFIQQQDIKMAFIFGLPFIIAGCLFIFHIAKRTALQHKEI